MRVRVLVRLKPGILDVQGASVGRALGSLGFDDVREVRVGKVLEVTLDAPDAAAARRRVEEMCTRLLANPVMEDYSVEMLD